MKAGSHGVLLVFSLLLILPSLSTPTSVATQSTGSIILVSRAGLPIIEDFATPLGLPTLSVEVEYVHSAWTCGQPDRWPYCDIGGPGPNDPKWIWRTPTTTDADTTKRETQLSICGYPVWYNHRTFEETFYIPEHATLITGQVTVNEDDVADIIVNGTDDPRLYDRRCGGFMEGSRTYDISEYLTTGWNTILFRAWECAGPPCTNDYATNPAAIIYRIAVTFTLAQGSTASICGFVWYDKNRDGQKSTSESGMSGVKVFIDVNSNLRLDWNDVNHNDRWDEGEGEQWTITDAEGRYCFENLEAGTYALREITPSGYLSTGDSYLDNDDFILTTVTEGETSDNNNFGDVCLRGGDARTIGFWGNKNGQKLINSQDIGFLNTLPLYASDGFPFKTAEDVGKYLRAANAREMRYMLSAQLVALELNVRHGFVDANSTVYVGCSGYGFLTIHQLITEAISALGGSNKTLQGCLKDALDGVNNNRNVVQSRPCRF